MLQETLSQCIYFFRIGIAPSALLISEGPFRRHIRGAYKAYEAPHYVSRAFSLYHIYIGIPAAYCYFQYIPMHKPRIKNYPSGKINENSEAFRPIHQQKIMSPIQGFFIRSMYGIIGTIRMVQATPFINSPLVFPQAI